jgi:hypothetical protein
VRRTELRPNPEKVRDWVDRSRQRARDRQAERVDGHLPRPALKKTARRRKVAIPKPVRERALRRSGGLCICGCGRRATQVHHVLDETKFPELALVEDNMVAVFHDCNQRHHFQPGGRLRREVLPACAVRLAESQPRYEAHLERTYPVSEMAA